MRIDLFSTVVFDHLKDAFGILDDNPAKAVSFDDGHEMNFI
jgi:hypothetical protein